MNSLRRAVAQIARSQSTAKRVVLCSAAHFLQPFSTVAEQSSKASTTTKSVDWPKPSEIPFQVKVVNSVNLIGHVDAPVQFQTSEDGKHWAGTVISQHASSHHPPLWIPILFEGDLAQIAVCHLKKNDHVHISGQLTADPPDGIEGQANVQVMVHSINFIEPASQKRNSFASKTAAATTINHSANISTTKKDGDSAWRGLLDNPEQWRDYRSDKLKGLVKHRHPDFKHKKGILSLWLNSAPDWVLPELDSIDMKMDVQTHEENSVTKSKVDDLWKDLVANPDKWWDNRSDKRSEKSPDFKHKETGKPLWLTYSPDWVKSLLPPVKSKQNAATGKRETLLS